MSLQENIMLVSKIKCITIYFNSEIFQHSFFLKEQIFTQLTFNIEYCVYNSYLN